MPILQVEAKLASAKQKSREWSRTLASLAFLRENFKNLLECSLLKHVKFHMLMGDAVA